MCLVSKSEDESAEFTPTPKTLDEIVGTSGTRNSWFNTGDYVLVKFSAKNVEYYYTVVIDIDEDENYLWVTFLKICDIFNRR